MQNADIYLLHITESLFQGTDSLYHNFPDLYSCMKWNQIIPGQFTLTKGHKVDMWTSIPPFRHFPYIGYQVQAELHELPDWRDTFN